MKTILISTFLILSACETTHHWYKDGAPAEAFKADSTSCVATSFEKFPVRRPTAAPASPATSTTCYQSGYNQMQCNSNQNALANGFQQLDNGLNSVADDNATGRQAAYDACMYSKGWKQKD